MDIKEMEESDTPEGQDSKWGNDTWISNENTNTDACFLFVPNTDCVDEKEKNIASL